jgi:hypothetical protein
MLSGYDIIGDIHGQADKLKSLLSRMGYRKNSDGVYAHSDRLAVFAADFIDMNAGQAEVLQMVRGMVEAGTAKAAMGNHEFNAICFATPSKNGGYIRPHHEKKHSSAPRFSR